MTLQFVKPDHSLTLLKYTPPELQVSTTLIIVFATLEIESLCSLDKCFTQPHFLYEYQKNLFIVFKSQSNSI